MDFLHSKELEEFYKNYDKNHPNEISSRCRNVYDIKTVDMDGNVVEQKFGLNLMTDYGFQRAYVYGYGYAYGGDPTNYLLIWIGEGTDIPKYDNTSLYGRFTTSTPQGSTGFYPWSKSNIDGMCYDKETNTCSITRKGQYGYYDYNITGLDGNVITEDKYIREIGIGEAWNKLTMHARVYDKDGNLSSITKKPNQRLYITTYITTTMDPTFIKEAYDEGTYILMDMRGLVRDIANEQMTGTQYFRGGHIPAHNGFAFLGVAAGHGYWVPFYGGGYNDESNGRFNHYDEETHTITFDNYGTVGAGLLEGKRHYVSEKEMMLSDVWDGNGNNRVHPCGISASQFVNIDEPEELENVTVHTDSYSTGNLSTSFGKYYSGKLPDGRVPTTDADVHKCLMYNHSTKEWDIEEEFINNPELQLYDFWIPRYAKVWTYITFLDSNRIAYVFVNTHTDRPITSFRQSGFTLYATDEYWDTDSWEAIGNIKAVPEELQCKRYYISLTDPSSWADMGGNDTDYLYYHRGRSLIPNRNVQYHEIIPNSPYKTYTLPYKNSMDRCTRTASDNTLGYVAYAGCLFYPDSIDPETNLPYAYRLTDESNSEIDISYLFGFGNKIIAIGRTASRPVKTYYYTRDDGPIITIPVDDRVVIDVPDDKYGHYAYYANPYGGDAIGFRVYTVGDDPTQAPTYEDFKYPTIRYNYNTYQYNQANYRGHVKYDQQLATTSSKGFVVVSSFSQVWSIFPTIINLHGGEDGDSVEIQELKDYKSAIAIDRTNYACIWIKNESKPFLFGIYNVMTKEVEQEFEFESGYTVMGFAGWKDYVYFLTSFNNETRSFVYHIDTQVLEYCPNETFWFLNDMINTVPNTTEGRINGYKARNGGVEAQKYILNQTSNDEITIFSVDRENDGYNYNPSFNEYSNCYFTSDNPTHREFVLPVHLNQREGSGGVYRNSTFLGYVNDENKQLIYGASSYNRLLVQDMGLRMDKPEGIDIDYYPYAKMPWQDGTSCMALFKDRVMVMDAQLGSITEIPIEYMIKHKLEMSTRTITSFNNPVHIDGGRMFTMSITNRVDPNGT